MFSYNFARPIIGQEPSQRSENPGLGAVPNGNYNTRSKKRKALTDISNITTNPSIEEKASNAFPKIYKKKTKTVSQPSTLPQTVADHLQQHQPSLPANLALPPAVPAPSGFVQPTPAIPDDRSGEPMEVEETKPSQGIQDIDAPDFSEPRLVSEYVNDIYKYLRDNELRHRPRILNFFEVLQREITPQMRGILVDWLVEVAEEYQLCSETLYLAVVLLDRYLAQVAVGKARLQLVGVACMFVSAKYEEVFPPTVDKFVYIAANTYTKQEILEMESHILNTLGFELTAVTSKLFLRRFLKAAGAYKNIVLTLLAYYLNELTLPEFTFVKYLPSVVAAAAVYLALRCFNRDECHVWTPTLEFYTGYHENDPQLLACVRDLYALYCSAPTSSLQAVREKYLQKRFRSVAALPPPAGMAF